MSEAFMDIEDHFVALQNDSPAAHQELYGTLKHSRVETAFVNRKFIVYEMDGREPKILEEIHVTDFVVDEKEGASCELVGKDSRALVVSYTPTQLFDYPVMVWLPLNLKLRWSAKPGEPSKGSLAFPFVVRTASRHHLRERNVIYCETGPTFGQQFNDLDLK